MIFIHIIAITITVSLCLAILGTTVHTLIKMFKGRDEGEE